MTAMLAHPNLVAGWIGILLGFISGAMLGLGFQNETWLGGFSSLRRRLYRLGHISFFGLALLNLAFYFTVRMVMADPPGEAARWLTWASHGFMVGAVTMPACCFLMAHCPRAHALFAVPVGSLVAAGALTIRAIWPVNV